MPESPGSGESPSQNGSGLPALHEQGQTSLPPSKRMDSPLRNSVQNKARSIRESRTALPTPLETPIRRSVRSKAQQIRESRASLPTPMENDIRNELVSKASKVNRPKPRPRVMPTPMRKSLLSGRRVLKQRERYHPVIEQISENILASTPTVPERSSTLGGRSTSSRRRTARAHQLTPMRPECPRPRASAGRKCEVVYEEEEEEGGGDDEDAQDGGNDEPLTFQLVRRSLLILLLFVLLGVSLVDFLMQWSWVDMMCILDCCYRMKWS